MNKTMTRCFYIPVGRRKLLKSLALASAGFMTRGAFAEALTLTATPWQTEGPFYPDRLPLDQDNDLVQITNHVTPAVGVITQIAGRVVDRSGAPFTRALIELWQADNNGCYIHSRGAENGERDPNFQGYGRFETASDGGYRFRTIKPALYPGRTRHYHFAVTLPGRKRFTTQLYFAGEPRNSEDGILESIKEPARRASIIRTFSPAADSIGLGVNWDIVMSLVPEDQEHGDEDEAPRRGGPRGPGGPPPREQ